MRNLVFSAAVLLAGVSLCHGEVIKGMNADGIKWNLILNFREGSGIIAKDSSTNTISTTLTNGPAWVSNRSGRGKALSFDGTDDIVVVPAGSEGLFDYGITSTFAVVVLLKNPSGGDNRILVSKGTWSTFGWWFRTGASGAKLGIYFRNNSAFQYFDSNVSNAEFINNNWHTAAFVYRGILHGTTGMEFWFDGVQRGVTDSGTDNGTSNFGNNANVVIGNDEAITFTNYLDTIGCVMLSRDGYAPSAKGMMDLHRRLMGQQGDLTQVQ